MKTFSILALLTLGGCALMDCKTETDCITEGVLNCTKEIEEIEEIYRRIELEIEQEEKGE